MFRSYSFDGSINWKPCLSRTAAGKSRLSHQRYGQTWLHCAIWCCMWRPVEYGWTSSAGYVSVSCNANLRNYSLQVARIFSIGGYTFVAGADVNIQDSRGRSALHISLLYGYNTIASKLLNANAAIDLQVNIFKKINGSSITNFKGQL